MNKKIFFITIIILIINTYLYPDKVDCFFNSDFSSIKIEKIKIPEKIKTENILYNICNQGLIYINTSNNSFKLILFNLNNLNETLIYTTKNNISLFNLIFNENQNQAIISFYEKSNDKKKKSSFKHIKINLIDFYMLDINSKNNLTKQKVHFWKNDKYNSEAWNDFYKENPNMKFINLGIHKRGLYKNHNLNYEIYQISFINSHEETFFDTLDIPIEKIDFDNIPNEKWKPLVISSLNYGFYTSKKGNLSNTLLKAYDYKRKIKTIKIKNINENEILDITHLENSSMNQEYLFVFGKYYEKEKYMDLINFMAIIRKKDLKVKYYPIKNNNFKNIDLKFGQYLVKDNKIIIANNQEDKSFITLVFE